MGIILMNTSIYDGADNDRNFSSASDAELHLILAGEARYFRSSIFRCGYLPVPLASAEKVPSEHDWPTKARARAGQTEWTDPITARDWNSGILCAGLYAVDVDVDDPDAADEVTAALLDTLGPSPAKRVRGHTSPRYLALYRAEGESRKQKVGKVDGYKVEILGLGQQCMVHGIHPDLGVVEWITPEGRSDDGLARVPRETLPLIKAVQIAEFLSRCRTIFGIGDDEPKTTDPEPWAPHGRERSDYTDNDVADIVAHLPADTGYDDWVAVLSAIYRATGGSARGRDLAHEYSRKSPAYRHRSVDEKWCAFRHGGALRHDFGHLLNRVKEAEPGYLTPSFRAKLSSARLEHAPASAGVPADQVIMDADF
ncbi:PriCT-2 domain-containing protein [Acidiphilium sp. C61]|uniref:PriCT-2 domain-containing protein n=1 Tax=Acidiphilium sp. C61 TaxID=1671485 RepID=UPI00157BAE19|nr:PriCT-2 domain-containing protein [Acidiphilium sp. C61]